MHSDGFRDVRTIELRQLFDFPSEQPLLLLN